MQRKVDAVVAGDQAKVMILVRVPPQDAFRIFTEEIDDWWRSGLKFKSVDDEGSELAQERRYPKQDDSPERPEHDDASGTCGSIHARSEQRERFSLHDHVVDGAQIRGRSNESCGVAPSLRCRAACGSRSRCSFRSALLGALSRNRLKYLLFEHFRPTTVCCEHRRAHRQKIAPYKFVQRTQIVRAR